MLFPKPTRIKNRKLLDESHSRRCIVCNRRVCDPAHVKSRGAGGDDVPDNIMDLCRWHHSEQGNIGIVTFTEKYLSVKLFLMAHGWEIVDVFGQKKLRKTAGLPTSP